jgi:hypothetical protein
MSVEVKVFKFHKEKELLWKTKRKEKWVERTTGVLEIYIPRDKQYIKFPRVIPIDIWERNCQAKGYVDSYTVKTYVCSEEFVNALYEYMGLRKQVRCA